jgi:DNA (cytosine-5)-methyltransferase 1
MNTFYEFFAGGGMARAGLGNKWSCLLANDFSAIKAQSYVANWGGDDLIVGDIFGIGLSEIPSLADLAWSSFPCQDLSVAGVGAGLSGQRSGAFWGFWNIVRDLRVVGRKPRTVVIENVYGAMTANGGKDFDLILQAIQSEGYVFGAVVVDAAYFVPQSRPRLFIICVDSGLVLPAETHSFAPSDLWHPDVLVRAYGRLSPHARNDWRWWSLPSPVLPVACLEDIIESEPEGVAWHSVAQTNELLNMMTELNRRKVLQAQALNTIKVGTIYKRTRLGVLRAEVRFDGIAGCLRAPTGGSSRQTIMVVDGSLVRTRLISAREAARLMGLPETYRLPTRYNDAYHLIGDGVVVPVVAHIERHLLSPVLAANHQNATRPASSGTATLSG